jgi:hypothetical protein
MDQEPIPERFILALGVVVAASFCWLSVFGLSAMFQ